MLLVGSRIIARLVQLTIVFEGTGLSWVCSSSQMGLYSLLQSQACDVALSPLVIVFQTLLILLGMHSTTGQCDKSTQSAWTKAFSCRGRCLKYHALVLWWDECIIQSWGCVPLPPLCTPWWSGWDFVGSWIYCPWVRCPPGICRAHIGPWCN